MLEYKIVTFLVDKIKNNSTCTLYLKPKDTYDIFLDGPSNRLNYKMLIISGGSFWVCRVKLTQSSLGFW